MPRALAQNSSEDEIAKYRAMPKEGNPAELTKMLGEELWRTERGTKNVSLEGCDLVKGPRVVEDTFRASGPGSDIAAIATYVAAQSNGMCFRVDTSHAAMQQAVRTGAKPF